MEGGVPRKRSPIDPHVSVQSWMGESLSTCAGTQQCRDSASKRYYNRDSPLSADQHTKRSTLYKDVRLVCRTMRTFQGAGALSAIIGTGAIWQAFLRPLATTPYSCYFSVWLTWQQWEESRTQQAVHNRLLFWSNDVEVLFGEVGYVFHFSHFVKETSSCTHKTYQTCN